MYGYGYDDWKSSSAFRNLLCFTLVTWYGALATSKWLLRLSQLS